jgi:hypothetical protein
MEADKEIEFWRKELNVKRKQFYKVIITPSRGSGSYKNKSKHGVLTVYFSNKKLRDYIINELPM